MSLILNIIWFVIVGWWSAIAWLLLGLLWCITLIGIPVGKQCFKFAKMSAVPFGKDIEFSNSTGKFLLNVIWIIFGGFEMALGYLASGVALACTIIGIPLALQCFKLVKLSLLPLGAKIVRKP